LDLGNRQSSLLTFVPHPPPQLPQSVGQLLQLSLELHILSPHTSILQAALQPSPLFVLPSSHCSHALIAPLPHNGPLGTKYNVFPTNSTVPHIALITSSQSMNHVNNMFHHVELP